MAAGEFAKAAVGTGSEEAMRTLKLLEQHHQKLSELLRLPSEVPVADLDVVTTSEKTVKASPAVSELLGTKAEVARSSSPRRSNPSASGIYVPRRMPPRDMSSSIASNLASARGIRSSHDRRALSPSVTPHQAPGSVEVPTRTSTQQSRQASNSIPNPIVGKPSWVPPVQNRSTPDTQVSRASAVAHTTPPSATEEGFQKFYSTFESFLSKISAPLAFAGLPLIAEEAPNNAPVRDAPQRAKRSLSRESSGEPDLSKMISRAALRASAHPAPGTDSFYVVPTTGHTATYANILSFAEKEKRRVAVTMHSEDPDLFEDPEEDDFVDAHETPAPDSPLARSRTASAKLKRPNELENKVEELYIENKSLKDCIDNLSKRLHAFEMSAQSSGLAMQESMRLMKPTSPSLAPVPNAAGPSDLQVKQTTMIKSMEEQLDVQHKDMQKLARENDKLRTVVSRYRERWEKLKEGAKTRREGGGKDQKDGDQNKPATG